MGQGQEVHARKLIEVSMEQVGKKQKHCNISLLTVLVFFYTPLACDL